MKCWLSFDSRSTDSEHVQKTYYYLATLLRALEENLIRIKNPKSKEILE
jgi:hypothetical protein